MWCRGGRDRTGWPTSGRGRGHRSLAHVDGLRVMGRGDGVLRWKLAPVVGPVLAPCPLHPAPAESARHQARPDVRSPGRPGLHHGAPVTGGRLVALRLGEQPGVTSGSWVCSADHIQASRSAHRSFVAFPRATSSTFHDQFGCRWRSSPGLTRARFKEVVDVLATQADRSPALGPIRAHGHFGGQVAVVDQRVDGVQGDAQQFGCLGSEDPVLAGEPVLASGPLSSVRIRGGAMRRTTSSVVFATVRNT